MNYASIHVSTLISYTQPSTYLLISIFISISNLFNEIVISLKYSNLIYVLIVVNNVILKFLSFITIFILTLITVYDNNLHVQMISIAIL